MTEDTIVSMFKDMIRLDTTNPKGNERLMTDYIARILTSHDIAYEIIEPEEGRANIIASIGTAADAPPILLISHLDVVSCEDQQWDHPPFDAIEKDGLIYGRGTLDTKHLTAMGLAAFLRLKDAELDRKVYFIATADEEKGSALGMPHIVKQYREELSGAYVINEGGGFFIEDAGRPFYLCTVGEKGRCEVHVSIKGDAGPASMICADKAVSKFTQLLDQLSSFEFPLEENEVYLLFSETLGESITDPMLKNFHWYNGHDAIILSSYDIGEQINVLPYHIEFDFSLQLLPGKTLEDAEAMLGEIFEGIDADYEITAFTGGFSSSCSTSIFSSLRELLPKYYRDAEILPVYALGRTDGRFLGPLPCDVYGFSPVTRTIDFHQVLRLVHQANEHIDRESLGTGADFLTELIQRTGCERR